MVQSQLSLAELALVLMLSTDSRTMPNSLCFPLFFLLPAKMITLYCSGGVGMTKAKLKVCLVGNLSNIWYHWNSYELLYMITILPMQRNLCLSLSYSWHKILLFRWAPPLYVLLCVPRPSFRLSVQEQIPPVRPAPIICNYIKLYITCQVLPNIMYL